MDDVKMEAMIKQAVGSALDDKLGQFFIEREQHYKDHAFVKDVRETADKIRGTACAAVTKAGITGLLVLIGWGVVEWIKRGLRQ